MKKDMKKALQQVFEAPPPKRKAAFLQSIKPVQREKSFFLVYAPMVRTAALCCLVLCFFGAWRHFKHLPVFRDRMPAIFIQTPSSTESDTPTDLFTDPSGVTPTDSASKEPVSAGADLTEPVSWKPTDPSASEENPPAFFPGEDPTEPPFSGDPTEPPAPSETTEQVPSTMPTNSPPETGAPTTGDVSPRPTEPEGVDSPHPIEPTPSGQEDNEPEPPADYTVTPYPLYTPVGSVYVVRSDSLSWDPDIDTSDLDAMAAGSDLVVTATVEERLYTDVWGVPYTVSQLRLVSVRKGTLQSRDRISLYTKGGYMPLEVYKQNNSLTLELEQVKDPWNATVLYECEVPPKLGKTFLFFLRRQSDGSYCLAYGIYYSSDVL